MFLIGQRLRSAYGLFGFVGKYDLKINFRRLLLSSCIFSFADDKITDDEILWYVKYNLLIVCF